MRMLILNYKRMKNDFLKFFIEKTFFLFGLCWLPRVGGFFTVCFCRNCGSTVRHAVRYGERIGG